ncbi:arginine---tRNA ligase [Synchytrium endobioticum]|uniref:arginine--tRNA ligase n=1 Tax=Synchytrium endobioticum TaxID=286115 RepID=A0A507D007_9FUNG|nr:arginine---tRNA ligase [Synchytrium endobioticum]TPX44767.1 arginine---tRNA ligase [Synchytrium endobioticum]
MHQLIAAILAATTSLPPAAIHPCIDGPKRNGRALSVDYTIHISRLLGKLHSNYEDDHEKPQGHPDHSRVIARVTELISAHDTHNVICQVIPSQHQILITILPAAFMTHAIRPLATALPIPQPDGFPTTDIEVLLPSARDSLNGYHIRSLNYARFLYECRRAQGCSDVRILVVAFDACTDTAPAWHITLVADWHADPSIPVVHESCTLPAVRAFIAHRSTTDPTMLGIGTSASPLAILATVRHRRPRAATQIVPHQLQRLSDAANRIVPCSPATVLVGKCSISSPSALAASTPRIRAIIDVRSPPDPDALATLLARSRLVVSDLSVKPCRDSTADPADAGLYVQYIHARICGIERSAAPCLNASADLSGLSRNNMALDLAVAIESFYQTFLRTVQEHEPSVLVSALIKLAHSTNRALSHLRVKGRRDNEDRWLLLYIARACIQNGLGLLGLKAAHFM